MKQNLAINGVLITIDNIFHWPVFEETDINSVPDVVHSGNLDNPDCGDLASWVYYKIYSKIFVSQRFLFTKI